MPLLADHIISAQLRYESHRLIYTPENADPIELGGVLAAAILAALLVDTPEGDARGIALDTPDERQAFFLRYERETRRDDWGHLVAEVQQLRENYIQLAVDAITLRTLCPNVRLLELALDVTVAYMRHLALETDWAFLSDETGVYRIIENQHVVIIRNNEKYDVTGKKLE